MENPKDKRPKYLYVARKNICIEIQDEKNRLETIFRYLYEKSWIDFVKYANSRGADEGTADDIFIDSILDLIMRMNDWKIIIICENDLINCIEFDAYMAGIRRNKLYDWLNNKEDDTLNEYYQRIQNNKKANKGQKDIMNKFERIDDDILDFLPDNTVPDYKMMNEIDDETRIKIVNFIYEKRLTAVRKKYFDMYLIEGLTHEQVVQLWLNDPEEYLSQKMAERLEKLKVLQKLDEFKAELNVLSRNLKSQLRAYIHSEMKSIINNKNLLDEIMAMNGNDYIS